jgi:hypothetical protein
VLRFANLLHNDCESDNYPQQIDIKDRPLPAKLTRNINKNKAPVDKKIVEPEKHRAFLAPRPTVLNIPTAQIEKKDDKDIDFEWEQSFDRELELHTKLFK